MSEIALKEPGVEDAVAFPGPLDQPALSTARPPGIVFVHVKPFDQRGLVPIVQ